MFEAPITFVEAESMLKARLDTPTALKHVEIAETWDAGFRQRAFFSARVTDAAILSELHDKVQAVVNGEATSRQARAILREYFAGPGADALSRMGFAPERDARTLGELSSIPRLDLIIETNVRMAQEVGHYQSWAEHADYFKYGVWRCGWAKEHREEHLAREGKVYRFDHPIWTQSPPGGEFNCKCYREIASDEDIERLGLKPEDAGAPFEPSSLGFDPSRAMRDPPPFGKRVRPEYQERAQRRIDEAAGRSGAVGPVAVPEAEDVQAMPIDRAMEKRAEDAEALRREVAKATRDAQAKASEVLKEIDETSARIDTAEERGLTGEAQKLRLKRVELFKRSKELANRATLNALDRVSLPEGDRARLTVTTARSSVIKAPVDEAASVVRKLTSKTLALSKPELVARSKRPGGRSHYKPGRAEMSIASGSPVATVAHEMGHYLEDANEHIHKRCVEFLDYRCKGEAPVSLSALTGAHYARWEVARKDRFHHPYCGKDYIAGGERYATEILSMGLQRLVAEPAAFIADDPEYAAFVLLLLRGAL